MAAPDFEKQIKDLKKDYGITFGSKEGERVIADLKSAYYKRSSFQRIPTKWLIEKDKDR